MSPRETSSDSPANPLRRPRASDASLPPRDDTSVLVTPDAPTPPGPRNLFEGPTEKANPLRGLRGLQSGIVPLAGAQGDPQATNPLRGLRLPEGVDTSLLHKAIGGTEIPHTVSDKYRVVPDKPQVLPPPPWDALGGGGGSSLHSARQGAVKRFTW